MTTKVLYFKDALKKKLEDPEFRKLYEEERETFEVARRVLELRHDLGLSQEEFAQRAGTTRQVISKVESGDYEAFSIQTLRKLLEATGARLVLGIEKAPKGASVRAARKESTKTVRDGDSFSASSRKSDVRLAGVNASKKGPQGRKRTVAKRGSRSVALKTHHLGNRK